MTTSIATMESIANHMIDEYATNTMNSINVCVTELVSNKKIEKEIWIGNYRLRIKVTTNKI